MKIHYDIKQKTEEWFEIKWGKVSGTSSKDLFGAKKVDDLALFDHIMGQKLSDVQIEEEGFVSAAMERGIQLEIDAIKELENDLGVKFLDAGFIERTSFHGHSPDGITEDEKIGAEAKVPNLKTHNLYCRKNEVPSEYRAQIINMFACVDTLEVVYFISYCPEHKKMPLFIKKVTRETILKVGTLKEQSVQLNADHLISRVDEMEIKIQDETKLLDERIINKTKF